MDIGEYVVARHPLLVRAGVLMGRPLERSRALVEQTLADQARRVTRADDPDPDVLHALHDAVLADRVEHPGEAEPTERPDQAPGLDDEGLAVRRTLGAMTPELRDAAVLLYFAHLTPADAADALGVKRRELPPLAVAALLALGAEDGEAARHDLAQAGDTIVVLPPGPLPASDARRRGWLLPAVAVTALVVVATAVSLGLRDDPPASPTADGASAPAAPLQLRGDQLPSFFAYRVADATQRLHELSLVASVERVDACEPPGVVLGTSPGIGATFRMGDSVAVTAARRGAAPCPGYRNRVVAWSFLDFASGRGPAPEFASRVTVVSDGGEPRTLGGEGAPLPAALSDALGPVADATARTAVDGAVYLAPALGARTTVPPAVACGLSRPPSLGRRVALELSLTLPTESGGCPLTVDLYRTDGAIDAVVVRSPRPQGTEPGGTP